MIVQRLRAFANHPLHVVAMCLAVGTWYVAFDDAGFARLTTGLILLALAMYNTPRLARMRGSLFSL